ncbi:MAG TPA: STAS domain-containing protein [bacterium]|nr:STAS domain-containing protein [bacterium]HNT66106.1 STAS domain-containing protein [bacterium]HOX87315.1 STAS domain-containing protein [bacterium]HPG46776.1 STAS domain-containing protein [bacterium]HPM98894.1 STAS domain-containing protein [bacterium]
MNNFQVIRNDDDKVTTLRIAGFLDAHTAPMLEREIEKLLEEGRYRILVDFAELGYISSAGLGVFMGYIEQVRENNGDIKMCRMNDKIYRVFDLLGFPTLYDIVTDEEMARAKFVQSSQGRVDRQDN